jgi:hypothetical protein
MVDKLADHVADDGGRQGQRHVKRVLSILADSNSESGVSGYEFLDSGYSDLPL